MIFLIFLPIALLLFTRGFFSQKLQYDILKEQHTKKPWEEECTPEDQLLVLEFLEWKKANKK